MVKVIRPVGDQAAGGDEKAFVVDRGQLVPSRKRDDQIATVLRRGARRHDQAAIRSVRECRDGALGLAGVAHVDRAYFHSERRRHSLDEVKLAGSGAKGSIPEDRRSRHARRDLFEQLQPFSADAVFEIHKSGGVAVRPRQAADKAGADRIGDHRNTIGTVRVACSIGPKVEAPEARMTSGASAANSAACLRTSAALAVAQRVSISTFWPMVQPNSASP